MVSPGCPREGQQLLAPAATALDDSTQGSPAWGAWKLPHSQIKAAEDEHTAEIATQLVSIRHAALPCRSSPLQGRC